MDDLVQKLRSQVGDDVAAIYDNEQLFRMAADEIERLRAWAEAAEAERDGAIAEQSEEVRRRIEAEAERDRLRLALRIIAGQEQCLDNLMSHADIARAALSDGDDGEQGAR